LPIVRTSPAHGTAYNIAGKNKANPKSMINAFYAAYDILSHRKEYQKIIPLKKKIFQNEKNLHQIVNIFYLLMPGCGITIYLSFQG